VSKKVVMCRKVVVAVEKRWCCVEKGSVKKGSESLPVTCLKELVVVEKSGGVVSKKVVVVEKRRVVSKKAVTCQKRGWWWLKRGNGVSKRAGGG
jgi:hypothetical protein